VLRGLTGVSGLAAAVLFLVLFLTARTDVLATPTEVIAAVRKASRHDQARCYRVTVDFSPGARELFPLLTQSPGARMLCTRGDRFVVEPGFGGLGAWGKDAAGRIWIAPTQAAAARFDEEALPTPLRNVLKIYELNLQPLLDEVLADFDLSWFTPPGTQDHNYIITARPRAEPGVLQVVSAELTIARKSQVIHCLSLTRKLWGNDTVTICFEHQAEGTRPEASFTAEGHISPSAPVYDRTKSLLRRRLLLQELGESGARGL
jgi:hypothetical protein